MTPRSTWVQPEDLIGHELRQAAEDGRDASAIEAPLARGGRPAAPARAGASAGPAPRICGPWPTSCSTNWPRRCPRRWPPTSRRGDAAPRRPPTASAAAAVPGLAGARHLPGRRQPAVRAAACTPPGWAGPPAACSGKPVEKLPLDGIRRLAQATGNWPLNSWFTAGASRRNSSPPTPGTAARAPTSLAENIDGMPEDDDLNYPLLNLLLLQRHGKAFTTADVARLWLDELPAGRTFTAERIAYRNLLQRPRTPAHRPPPQPLPRVDRRPDPRRRPRLDPPRRPGGRRRTGPPGRRPSPTPPTACTARCSRRPPSPQAASGTGRRPHLPAHRPHRRSPRTPAWPRPIRHAIQLAGHTPGLRHGRRRTPRHPRPTTTGCTSSPTPPCSPPPSPTPTATSPAPSAVPCPAAGTPTPTARPPARIAGPARRRPRALPDRWTAPLKNRLATSVADFDGIGFDTLRPPHRSRTRSPRETSEATRP